MKKKKTVKTLLGTLLSLCLVLCLAFVGCGTNGGGGGGGGTITPPPDDEDPYVTELQVVTPPLKTEYKVGQKFDPAGMTLVAKWSHGIDEELAPGECTVSPKGGLEKGTTQITFTYEGKTYIQNITVKDVAVSSASFDFSAIDPVQLPGRLDLTEIEVTLNYEDGSSEKADAMDCVMSENGVVIANPTAYVVKSGAHSITVTYGEYSEVLNFMGFDGYSVLSTTLVKQSELEADREQYIGTNFIEAPAGADGYDAAPEQGIPCIRHLRAGHIMRYHIYSEYDVTVELVLSAASTYQLVGDWSAPTRLEDMQFNKVFEISHVEVDPDTGLPMLESGVEVKTPIEVADYVILPGCESEVGTMQLWVNFVDVSFGEVDLKQGDNIIEMKVVSQYRNKYNELCAANINKLTVLTQYSDEHEHEPVKTDGKAAACNKAGYADYFRCAVCGRTFDDEACTQRLYNAPKPIPATGVHIPDGEATCTHASRCTDCGKVIEAKKPHIFGEAGSAESHKCQICQTVFTGATCSGVWHENTLECAYCENVLGYKIQGEDTSKVKCFKADGTEITPGREATTWIGESITNGCEGLTMSNMSPGDNANWNNATVEITVNVAEAGDYGFAFRAHACGTDGGKEPMDCASMFSYCVNPADGEDRIYSAVSGKVLPSSDNGGWSRMYQWGITELATVTLNAGENKIVLKFNDGAERMPNIDYFTVQKVGYGRTEAEIVATREGANVFKLNTGVVRDLVLPGVYIRVAVPDDKLDEVGALYRDILITKEMCDAAGFDTSSLGEKSATFTVEVYGKTYTATFDYTVEE